MIADFFRLAYLSVKSRKLRSWLTMLGIFIGIAAVVSLISLGQGLENAINEQFSTLGTDTLFVFPKGSVLEHPGTIGSIMMSEDDLKIVKKTRGVSGAASRLLRRAEINYKDVNSFELIASLPEEREDREIVLDALNFKVESGKMIRPKDDNKVMLGNNYGTRNKMGVNLGPGDRIEINGKTFRVSGILERKGNVEFDDAILMNKNAMRELFDVEDEIDAILVKVDKGFNPSLVAEGVYDELRDFRNVEKGREDFEVRSSEDLLNTISNILLILQIFLIGVAAISLVVGGIGIMNTTYTSVLERTKEIGIMKSVGARNFDILMVFVIESGFYGLFGGIVGVLIGLGIGTLVEYIAFSYFGTTLFKASYSLFLIIGSLVFSFLIGCLSGALPAYQASKLKPVDALRYE